MYIYIYIYIYKTRLKQRFDKMCNFVFSFAQEKRKEHKTEAATGDVM